MNEDEKKAQDLTLALNEARQKEIESIRVRMEDFLRGQIEIKHEVEIVAKGQDSLKERFEMGVSKTLSNLDKKFDAFMVEWGTKKAEDIQRDKNILSVEKKADTAIERFDKVIFPAILTVCISVLLLVITYLAKRHW